MKICCTCKIKKEYSEFGILKRSKDGYRLDCRQCRKNKYYLNHEKSLIQKRNDHKRHKEERNKKCREYHQRNKEKLNKQSREYYRENHSELRRKMNLYSKEYKNRPLVKIAERLRNRIRTCVKLYNLNKENKSLEYLGCNLEFFVKYLESLFKDNMSWENYGFGQGKWVIDHIKPLCSFDLTNQDEIYKALNYTNLRPLWWEENSSKATEDKLLSIR